MPALGLCINARDAIPDRFEFAALGMGAGDWVRTNVDGSLSLVAMMLDLLPPEISVMVTMNNQCAEVRADWSGWDDACRMVVNIAGLHPGRIKIVGSGNELDSYYYREEPRMSPAFAADLVRRAAPILRPAGIKVAMTGLASGSWPSYLADMAARCRGFADYADLHLYVKSIHRIPEDPGWQTAAAALAQAAEISGLPVIASEAGIKVQDAGGPTWQGRWAEGLGELQAELICYWCWHDKMASPGETGGSAFGARGLDGQAKPVWSVLQSLFRGPLAPPAVPPARYQMGFADWADADRALLGDPLEDERGGLPGFSQQRTTNGILTAADIDERGWTLLFWEERTGTRYLFEDGHSRRIA